MACGRDGECGDLRVVKTLRRADDAGYHVGVARWAGLRDNNRKDAA